MRKRNEETLSPPGLNRFGFGFGGLSGIGTIRPVLVCLFGSLTFKAGGFGVFWVGCLFFGEWM